MQDIGQTTVMLFGNALDPRGRANHPKPASTRPHGNQMGTVLAKDKPVWRSRYNETLITGRTLREMVVPAIERHGPIKAWIVDDTGFPKQGSHSVGVHHQYCGQLGKQANCQVAVTLSPANRHASLPIAYQLYLPKDWAEDAARRNKAHVPEAIRFRTKPQIALAQISAALAAGVAPGVVLMDASYGTNTALRTDIDALGLTYVAAIVSTVKVRAAKNPQLRVSVKELALALPKHAWRI